MNPEQTRYSPGKMRDAIIHIMSQSTASMSINDIEMRVNQIVGPTPSSSIRSYLRLNTPDVFTREDRGVYRLTANAAGVNRDTRQRTDWKEPFVFKKTSLIHGDC